MGKPILLMALLMAAVIEPATGCHNAGPATAAAAAATAWDSRSVLAGPIVDVARAARRPLIPGRRLGGISVTRG